MMNSFFIHCNSKFTFYFAFYGISCTLSRHSERNVSGAWESTIVYYSWTSAITNSGRLPRRYAPRNDDFILSAKIITHSAVEHVLGFFNRFRYQLFLPLYTLYLFGELLLQINRRNTYYTFLHICSGHTP